MTENKYTDQVQQSLKLRRFIMEMLYKNFKEFPYSTIELVQIAEESSADADELNWNIVYLEKCQFVELGRSYESPPFIACSAAITSLGIESIENKETFDLKFPVENRKKT